MLYAAATPHTRKAKRDAADAVAADDYRCHVRRSSVQWGTGDWPLLEARRRTPTDAGRALTNGKAAMALARPDASVDTRVFISLPSRSLSRLLFSRGYASTALLLFIGHSIVPFPVATSQWRCLTERLFLSRLFLNCPLLTHFDFKVF